MKLSLIIIAVVTVIAWVFYGLAPKNSGEDIQTQQLPWSITIDDQGNTQVFGITLDTTTLGEVLALLGSEYEMGIIKTETETPSLEVFYGHFRAGPIQGKLTLSFNAKASQLESMVENSANMEFTATAAHKYFLNESDVEQAKTLSVRSMSFVPSASLEESVVKARFGLPEDIISTTETQSHYLYPTLGLDIFVDEDGKDRIQYVSPSRFQQILEPLQNRPSAM